MVQEDDLNLIAPDEIAYRLELTPGELKVTYSALKSFFNALGHDEYDVQRIVRSVLDKLPPPESVAAIDLRLPRGRPRL
jgi:hypothetical protein